MVLKSDKIRLRKMLSDSITVLCRAGLPFQSKVQVEALIGITLDDSEVILVSFKETMSSNGLTLSSDLADEDDTDDKRSFVMDGDQNGNPASVTIKEEYADVEWDAADYKRKKRRRRSAGAQKFGDFDDSGGERAKASSNVEQDEQFVNGSTEMDGQPAGGDYEHFDGSLVNDNRLDQNFSGEGHRGFRAQMKVEASDAFDDNTDDCMIVKSEEPALRECYEVDDAQTWDEHADMFDGNNFHALQGVGVPGDATAYDEDPNWLPQLSKPPAKKFKMPLQQRRQTWMARPSSTHTKSRNFQPTGKLHSKPTPQLINNEVTSSWRDENWSVEDGQQLTCKYCGIQLNTVRSLQEHVRGVHLKLNSYSCDFCHQTFKWRMALSRHRRNFHKLFIKKNVKFEN